MRNAVLWGVLAVTLVVANWSIADKERVLATGETMLLQLAPRDPRSLLQGDYVVLRYTLAREVASRLNAPFSADGAAVVRLDPNDVASFVRLAEPNEVLAGDERLLRYRKRGESLRVAADAYFYEEGQGNLYAAARYGELLVDASGEAVLVGMRDAELRRLGRTVN
jgi:uncharacterized membrane-anchored protein